MIVNFTDIALHKENDMSISRSLINVESNTPEVIDAENLQFTRVEKWGVSRTSLLEQKQALEVVIAEKTARLQEIDNLLALFR